MRDLIIKKQEHRLALLREIYEATGGRENIGIREHAFIVAASKKLEISEAECRDALRWLFSEGLCKGMTIGSFSITHAGACEVEDAETQPNRGTDHFDPVAIQNIHIASGAVVGAVQSGSQNTAHVAQQINAPPAEIAKAFATLRGALGQVPEIDREEVSDALAGLEEQAKAEKPKAGLVRSFARTLNAFLQGYGPTIAVIVEFIIARAAG